MANSTYGTVPALERIRHAHINFIIRYYKPRMLTLVQGQLRESNTL